MSESLRTWVYADGFNLYYGLLKNTKYKWLNLAKLCRVYLNTERNPVTKIKYFTAQVVSRNSDPTQHVRQSTYFRALSTLPEIEIIYGHFMSHRVSMPRADGKGKVAVIKTEEKKSDVNIAVHMLNDAYQDKYDLGVLISNDSDLEEPLRLIKEVVGKKVAVLNPQARPSRVLKQHVLFYKQIRKSVLQECQFPYQMKDSTGNFHIPDAWH